MNKILIVDDAPEILTWLGSVLEQEGWTVRTADCGEQAKACLESEDIRLVITDWMMPGMDGIELIEWIRARNPSHYVYCILMTARGTEEDSILGLSSGADDYLVKPTSAGIIHARLEVATRILEMQQTLLNQKEHLRHSRDMVEKAFAGMRREVKQAALQQRANLNVTPSLPRGVEAEWRYLSASYLSGDHFDFTRLGDDTLAFYLLDVGGHGISAALRTSALVELLRPFSSIMSDLLSTGPETVLSKLNQHICEASEEVEYLATLVFGTLNISTGRLNISSAGHPCPIVLNSDGEISDIAVSGLPLGVMPESQYESNRARLRPGESIVIYSDGITDCVNGRDETFGHKRLRECVMAATDNRPATVVNHVATSLRRWRGENELKDDATLLAIGLTPDFPTTIEI